MRGKLLFIERLREIGNGFQRAFWIANISELFERLSYYAAFASLARYLHESLRFPLSRASSLTGFFGGLVWFLAAFGGIAVDRLGYRRALSLAYFILGWSYFLLGSLGDRWLDPMRTHLSLTVLVGLLLALPAIGIAMVKPAVLGTTACASDERVRPIAYSLYYTIVNFGGAAGPFVASWVHRHFSMESVFRVAAACIFLVFAAIVLSFREPLRDVNVKSVTISEAFITFRSIAKDFRFMLFVVIFSGYWIAFWQKFITLPLYVHAYIDPNADTELMLVTGPVIVAFLTIPVNALMQRIGSLPAIILGTQISALAWIAPIISPSVHGAYVAQIVLALGEIVQSPRYYEYISRLAPPGREASYMGFAFVPIGIGAIAAGVAGGSLMHHFGELGHQPQRMWWVVTGVGTITAVLLWAYYKTVAVQASTSRLDRKQSGDTACPI